MYSILYLVTGLLFVVGVAAYIRFCIQLSQDIHSGRIVAHPEVESRKKS